MVYFWGNYKLCFSRVTTSKSIFYLKLWTSPQITMHVDSFFAQFKTKRNTGTSMYTNVWVICLVSVSCFSFCWYSLAFQSRRLKANWIFAFAEKPGVLQVVRSQTVQLHSSKPGLAWDKNYNPYMLLMFVYTPVPSFCFTV